MNAKAEAEGGIVPVVGHVSGERPPIGTVLAACVGAGIAHLGTSTMPFQVGALMDGLGLSASAAGMFGFFEVGALAISMLLISPFISRLNPALIAFGGGGIGTIAHLLLYHAPGTLPILCLIAALAGAGYGLVFAAMVSGVAACRNADRIYAIANGGALVVIVALMAALPAASARFGPMGPFIGIAIVILITAPAYLGFSNCPRSKQDPSALPFQKVGVVPLLAIWAAFSLGTGAVWSFAERIGNHLQLAPETVGVILSASTLCGMAGTMVGAALSGKIGRLTALLIGLTATAAGCLLLGFAFNAVSYALGVLCYWVFYMFLYSYLLGSAAAIDPSGRIGTAGGGCERLGFALGAPLGGILVDHLSYQAVGMLGAIGCLGLLPICIAPLRRAFAQDTHPVP
ncbi:MFS transporter [Sphingobium sp.]|uniref:MFS transporter n=1 Tax=Sphingobium sp. TaxID=1912891 RepID=UPI0028BD95F4|nr:MFS transporter [Sphingobium sp.]